MEPVESAAEGDVDARIRGMLPRLTAKRRRLATLVLDEPLFVALASAEQVGERAGVDPATVVRFARQVGFDGFADLRAELRARVPQLTPAEKVRRRLDEPPPAGTGPALASVAQDVTNVAQLNDVLGDEERLQDVADRILRAGTVVLLSGGLADAVTITFAHLLRLIGVHAVHHTSEVSAAVDVARTGAGDVVIAVSFWRYVNTPNRLFDLARSRGAWTLAITDSRAAPIAASADTVLTATVDAPEVSLSVVAPIALVNAITSLCAATEPERAVLALSAVDDIYTAGLIASGTAPGRTGPEPVGGRPKVARRRTTATGSTKKGRQ
jgi:DNA-binding MurR/RpiR family transcriptional regulator